MILSASRVFSSSTALKFSECSILIHLEHFFLDAVNFLTAFGKLDQMLETLESSDVSLEDSFRLYKEGMELLNKCSQKIDRVEKKMLQMNEDGTFREF